MGTTLNSKPRFTSEIPCGAKYANIFASRLRWYWRGDWQGWRRGDEVRRPFRVCSPLVQNRSQGTRARRAFRDAQENDPDRQCGAEAAQASKHRVSRKNFCLFSTSGLEVRFES